eukprot:PhF_6_TR7252/c0_g1_i1/m.10826
MNFRDALITAKSILHQHNLTPSIPLTESEANIVARQVLLTHFMENGSQMTPSDERLLNYCSDSLQNIYAQHLSPPRGVSAGVSRPWMCPSDTESLPDGSMAAFSTAPPTPKSKAYLREVGTHAMPVDCCVQTDVERQPKIVPPPPSAPPVHIHVTIPKAVDLKKRRPHCTPVYSPPTQCVVCHAVLHGRFCHHCGRKAL